MKYIFTEEQFITLLVLAGQKNIYMFRQKEDLDDSAIVSAVAQLYGRRQVAQRRGKLVLSKEIMEIVNIIGQSEYLIDIAFTGGGFGQQLLYPGKQGNIIVLEKQKYPKPSVIKVWRTEIQEYIQDLFANDRLPKSLAADRKEAKGLEKTALEEMSGEYKDEDIVLKIQRVKTNNGKKESRIDVFSSPVFQWIHIWKKSDSCYHLYSAEEIAGLLLSEIKGEEI